ncbi:hypothetical protein [Hyalangium versicolor]|uniref:hypothetical protein n=1 Tax=Hyalangium versicolor TaxID=2861190 RepID=UPI001CCF5389|nr:hypothetical protein [Hyalangium versicolor]
MLRALLIAGLWSSTAPALPPEASPAPEGSSAASALRVSLPQGWSLHTMKEEGFQVALPPQPMLRRHTMQTASGPAQITKWVVKRGHEDLVVGVSRFDPGVVSKSPAEPGALLANLRDEMMSGFRATLRSDKSLRVEGPPGTSSSYPAREFELLLPEDTHLTARIILVEDRLITLLHSTKGTSNKSFHLMVASFSFL